MILQNTDTADRVRYHDMLISHYLALLMTGEGCERDAELTLPVDFASSSKFCEDCQIKESDLSTGVHEGTGAPEGFLSYTDKAFASTMCDPTVMKVVDRYNNEWGYSCRVMNLNKHMANEDAKDQSLSKMKIDQVAVKDKQLSSMWVSTYHRINKILTSSQTPHALTLLCKPSCMPWKMVPSLSTLLIPWPT